MYYAEAEMVDEAAVTARETHLRVAATLKAKRVPDSIKFHRCSVRLNHNKENGNGLVQTLRSVAKR